MSEKLIDLLQLVLTPGVGPRTARAAIEYFGSASEVLRVGRRRLQEVRGVGSRLAENLQRPMRREDAEEELRLAESAGVRLLSVDDEAYPEGIRRLGEDAPLVLYVCGELAGRDALAAAVVGSRSATHYGKRMAKRIAGGLAAAGLTVVSGLARGIDSCAHEAALSAGGRTIAVIGCGLGSKHCRRETDLFERITASGAVISELPMRTPPDAANFPPRNRLISALSHAVVIVEASLRSGSLITANWALDQGKEVLAVPGNVDSPTSQGTNKLIKEGARLVDGADDVLRSLGPLPETVELDGEETADPRIASLKGPERQVFGLLGSAPLSVDEVVEQTGLSPAVVASVLMMLEVKRLAVQAPGQRYLRSAPE